jgi:molecular chaperone GrpE
LIDRGDLLQRFEAWLDATLAREDPPPGIPAEFLVDDLAETDDVAKDRQALWAAVTALTQEVKLQGRTFKQLSDTLSRDTEKRSRQEVLDTLLDLRERLLRGLESVRGRPRLQPVFWDRIFRRRWEQVRQALDVVEALEQGYRLGLESLNDLLAKFEIRPIECEGRPFDPRLMSAVDAEETARAADGTVLAVYRNGYEWNGDVYRPAQVRVARRPRSES